jgi:hypothetical protein
MISLESTAFLASFFRHSRLPFETIFRAWTLFPFVCNISPLSAAEEGAFQTKSRTEDIFWVFRKWGAREAKRKPNLSPKQQRDLSAAKMGFIAVETAVI